jgi:D-alanine-D-alanine ligase and related ATP-grasp enzymes
MADKEDSSEVQEVERLALETWRKLECCDVGRVDVRCGLDGRPYVLEVSGLYMMHWLVADIITLSA